MEGDYEAHKEILNFLVDIFNHISNPGNLKTIILETNRELGEINWFGLPTIFKELFKNLSEKQSDPTLYGATVRLIASFYQKKAMTIADEVENLIEELSEWNYDRAVGLALAAEGLLSFNEERSLTLLNKALNYAYEIPDRSDKSIAFCEILPILYKADMKIVIPDVFDEIVYEPKKIEASMIIAERESENSALIKNVLNSLPNEKKNLFYAARANHTRNQEVREELCSKALENVGSGIDAAKTKEKVFEVYHQHNNHNKASELVQDLSHELFKNVSKRPYVSTLIDLISFLLSRGDTEKGFNMLRKLKNRTGGLGSANRLFIINKIANILSINGFFEEGLKAYHETLNILGELDELSLSSSLISIGVSILTTLNYFPQDFPQEILNETVGKIRAKGKIQRTFELSQGNIDYLEKISLDRTVSDTVDELVLSERRRDRLEIDSKVRNLLNKLIKKMPSVVINYLLQYVYTVSLPESERSMLISMIMRSGSQLTEGNTKRAERYVSLAVEKLINHNIPLSPIIVQLVDMYLLKMM